MAALAFPKTPPPDVPGFFVLQRMVHSGALAGCDSLEFVRAEPAATGVGCKVTSSRHFSCWALPGSSLVKLYGYVGQ